MTTKVLTNGHPFCRSTLVWCEESVQVSWNGQGLWQIFWLPRTGEDFNIEVRQMAFNTKATALADARELTFLSRVALGSLDEQLGTRVSRGSIQTKLAEHGLKRQKSL